MCVLSRKIIFQPMCFPSVLVLRGINSQAHQDDRGICKMPNPEMTIHYTHVTLYIYIHTVRITSENNSINTCQKNRDSLIYRYLQISTVENQHDSNMIPSPRCLSPDQQHRPATQYASPGRHVWCGKNHGILTSHDWEWFIYTIIYRYIPLYTIIYHCIPLYTIIYHYIPLYTIIYHYIPLYTIIYHYIPLYTIIYHYIPLYTIIYHYIPLYTIIYHL